MTVKETLIAARELIADESRWTQRAWGRDASGASLASSNLSEAKQLCAWGALLKVDGPQEQAAMSQLDRTAVKLFQLHPIEVNDIMGHEAILKCFDEAILDEAILEAEGSQS